MKPLSESWGHDRGLPIHRYYIEQFLNEFGGDIRGHCLEFMHDVYTTRFGDGAVTRLDILHIDSSNLRATIAADLTQPNNVPSDTFDCIIATQVLHLVTDFHRVTSELHRILKPGGVLLVTVPQISMCDANWHECWRFTSEGLALVLGKAFSAENVSIRAYGNSLTSACEIRGIASDELSPAVLNEHDHRFAVEVCGRALKLR